MLHSPVQLRPALPALGLAAMLVCGCGERHGNGIFDAPNAWTKDVSAMDKSPESNGIIYSLAESGGWGKGQLRIDFSISLVVADATTPKFPFEPTGDFFEPDCDRVPFPLPAGGVVEGEQGYACRQDGDCHLLVLHPGERRLYEMWRADLDGGVFRGGCAAVWDLTRAYPETLRGEGCTSADAGGFPVAAMLFSADEVAAGSIDHAVRFALPNDRIRSGVYVRPSTHATYSASGGSDAPPYGTRLRLRRDFPTSSLPNAGARVIARALQTYGMVLSDGGHIALTAASDRFSSHKWADLGIDSYSLAAIGIEDMEVTDMGEPIEYEGTCHRNDD